MATRAPATVRIVDSRVTMLVASSLLARLRVWLGSDRHIMVAINASKTVTPVFQARTIREPINGSLDDNRNARAATTSEVRKRNPGRSTHGIRVSCIFAFFTKYRNWAARIPSSCKNRGSLSASLLGEKELNAYSLDDL